LLLLSDSSFSGHITLKKEKSEEDEKKNSRGKIFITGEELKQSNSIITFTMSASNLDKKDFFGKSDPFLVLNRITPDGKLIPVHKTEVIKVTLNPKWKKFSLSLSTLCNCDLEAPIVIECYDWNRSGKMDFIGSVQVLAKQLVSQTTFPVHFDLINEKKKQKGKNGGLAGVLNLDFIETSRQYSFVDYLQGGCEISMIVSIDYTGSNGAPSQKNSLHYYNPATPNLMNGYMEAICSVGEILSYYDSDKLFPTFGFGAKVNNAVSHCFPLNFNEQNPCVAGVQGILQAYINSLTTVELWGPTNFAPTIKTATQYALNQSANGQVYTVLLILTDGIITDMNLTKDALVEAANAPLSVVIVGIGNADFSEMVALDGDTVPLTNRHGERISRDIVQFVPFRDFRSQHYSALANEVLYEVPKQVTEYYNTRRIPPKLAVNPLIQDVI